MNDTNDLGQIRCSLGIIAYNEEANIGRLLEAVVTQRMTSVALTEIIIVASGCTDHTEAIVTEWAGRDPRVRLLTQAQREGKASAVNYFLSNACERIVLVCSADVLPANDTIEQLVAPFTNLELALTSSRPVPVNDPSFFMGFAAHLLWNLHHQINLIDFKAGELIAFRKIFERIPYRTAVDEASIESLIHAQGYQVRYVGTAITHNKGPETVKDFLLQRRRIHSGRLALRAGVGYRVATLSGMRILRLVVRHLDWHPRAFMWTCAVALLEAYGRFLGRYDYKRGRVQNV
jgi:biofilm PGA synthesis N-glycosyltransferase PgaC